MDTAADRKADIQALPTRTFASVRKLTDILDVSSFTVTQAYEQLVATNVLMAKPNSGYYVLPQQITLES